MQNSPMLPFATPLINGILVRRYKRFLADIQLEDGSLITAHCPNPGAMLGLTNVGAKVALSFHNSITRKLAYSWEMVWHDDQWVGVNTHNPNKIVAKALELKYIKQLACYDQIKAEVKYGVNSRIDFLLTNTTNNSQCLLEVKNVHLVREYINNQGVAEFPDCVTARGAKHQGELAAQAKLGIKCVVLYVMQRGDVGFFKIAADLDVNYSKAAIIAKAAGVESIAYGCDLDTSGISLKNPLEII